MITFVYLSLRSPLLSSEIHITTSFKWQIYNSSNNKQQECHARRKSSTVEVAKALNEGLGSGQLNANALYSPSSLIPVV